MMSFRTPYYSDCHPTASEENLTDRQYLVSTSSRNRNGYPDSNYYQGNVVPLRHMSGSHSSTGDPKAKKRIGTLDISNPMEQETLLDPGPVRLAPCWESKHAPNDEIHFKTSLRKGDGESKPPTDRLNLVFLILLLHGIGTLMPWNIFITAKSYFVDYKLNPNVTENSTIEYNSHFLSYLGVASQVPNVICSALNIFVQFGGGSLTFRIIASILVEIIILIITIVLAMLDTSEWMGAFFYITMASVVIINMANGIYQNSIYGLAAKLPMKYSMAIVMGNNTCGILTSLIMIASIAASPNLRTAAIYYFITALFFLLACIDTYFALPLIHFYRYHDRIVQKAMTDNRLNSRRPPYWKIFAKTWPQCFNVFFVFFVTLAIFPAIHSDIEPLDPNFPIPKLYFSPVTCYLTFNFFSMIGSLLPKWIKWPSRRFLWIPVVFRVILIPFFMLCNYNPKKRQIPVLITNDWAYFGLSIVLGLTNGYYSSLSMMYAPGCVETEHAPVAGMMAALFLVLGLVCGVNFTFFLAWLCETKLVKY